MLFMVLIYGLLIKTIVDKFNEKVFCFVVNNYLKIKNNNYFWRTYDQQELDWLEEKGEELAGFEFKWSETKKVKIPAAFAKAYPEATFEVINKSNYLDFIM